MTGRTRVAWWSLLVSALATGCGREDARPTAPAPGRSFLEGRWTGTLLIERSGEPSSSGQVSWTFETVDGTNLQSFRVTIRSQHAWLPITTTVTSALTPSNQPPGRLSTQGQYPSPRGCTGTLLSVGNADTHTIDADFSGVDCSTLTNSTFTGHVMLTKTE